ncbi:MAG: type II secretion system protein [Parcubacteria group bacterium]|nr:type II secretion system protein [Parcubacteria group bacterium]
MATKMARGFTLVELLVTISIIIVLTTVLLGYSRSNEPQLILLREQAQLVNTIFRAKAFSVQALNEPDIPCGIGVHFEWGGRYFIFRDRSVSCADSDHVWQANGDDQIIANEDRQLDSKISFWVLQISDVVFVPPDPQTYLNGSLSFGDAQIKIRVTAAPNPSQTIIINNAGQITVQ